MQNNKLVTIVGETATGKSSLAHETARELDGEIISADSWAIYKGMDIGTAKPTQEEQSQVKYHLIDIINPDEDFTAAEFKNKAQDAIDNIKSREKLPILVGGTGLYVDSVLYDYSFLPAGSEEQREQLNKKTIPQLIALIKEKDISLKGIDKRNKRRLVRLIESDGERPTKKPLRSDSLVIGLRMPSRNKLRNRIERRVDTMFARGLKYEVKELAETYGWDIEAMKGIGYQEFEAYFNGDQSGQQTRRKIVRSTMHLAKRQRTWFKRNQDIEWFEDRSVAKERIHEFVKKV